MTTVVLLYVSWLGVYLARKLIQILWLKRGRETQRDRLGDS